MAQQMELELRGPFRVFVYGLAPPIPTLQFPVETAQITGDEWQLFSNALKASCNEGERLVAIVSLLTGQAVPNVHDSLPRSIFTILWHPEATENPMLRDTASRAGYRMITHSIDAVCVALATAAKQLGGGTLCCEWCGMHGLTPHDLWYHYPLYHINEQYIAGNCQICRAHTSNLLPHVHDKHSPHGGAPSERTGVFSLVVVRRPRDGKFLMTQEFAGEGFWLPGGGVDPGETLIEGALRECIEEAGVHVVVKGLLDVTSASDRLWRRVIFYAEPVDNNAIPKTAPDFESVGACWVALEDLSRIPLRSAKEPTTWFPYVAAGGTVHPLVLPAQYISAFRGFPIGQQQ